VGRYVVVFRDDVNGGVLRRELPPEWLRQRHAATEPTASELAASEPAASEPAASEPAASEPETTGERVKTMFRKGKDTEPLTVSAAALERQRKAVDDMALEKV